MTWYPIAHTPPQFENSSGLPYSGGVLKAYSAGTSTPISMATDYLGGTTAATFTLNASGYPTSGGTIIIPHVQENCKLALYPNQAAADANSGAIWNPDNIQLANAIANDSVTNAMLTEMPTLTIKGNNTGGTANPADLTVPQVQAMLGKVLTSITGFLPVGMASNTSTALTFTISAGIANDSTNRVVLSGGSFSWTVANGNTANGYQGGTTLPNSTTIHFFVIAKSDLSAYASFASSSINPTLPTGYSGGYYRRIFSLPTTAAGAIAGNGTNGVAEGAGGSMIYYYSTSILDISITNLGTSITLYPLTVPTGIIVKPFYKYNMPTTGKAISLICGAQEGSAALPAYSAAGWTVAPGYDAHYDNAAYITQPKSDGNLLTDTNGKIYALSTGASTALYLVTRGFEDFRR